MARQTAAEKAETARADAEAKESRERAALAKRKSEIADLLTEVLGEALTRVSRTEGSKPSETDDLDRILAARSWPPRYSGGGHRDGEIIPRRFSMMTWLKATPWLFEPFLLSGSGAEVPGDFWSIDEIEGDPVAVISCPCGESPLVPHASFEFCPGGDCKRVFLHLGKSIRVAHLTDEQLEALAEPLDPDNPPPPQG